jgi:hypothetical protein
MHALKFSRTISRVKVELKIKASKTCSVFIIKVDPDYGNGAGL